MHMMFEIGIHISLQKEDTNLEMINKENFGQISAGRCYDHYKLKYSLRKI